MNNLQFLFFVFVFLTSNSLFSQTKKDELIPITKKGVLYQLDNQQETPAPYTTKSSSKSDLTSENKKRRQINAQLVLIDNQISVGTNSPSSNDKNNDAVKSKRIKMTRVKMELISD